MIILTAEQIIDTTQCQIMADLNLKRTSNNFNNTPLYKVNVSGQHSINSPVIEYTVLSGKNILMDESDNTILAVQYTLFHNVASPFFKKGAYVIRLSKLFLETYKYKSLFTSFKSHILKPFIESGGLVEVAPTQRQLLEGISESLNLDSHLTIAEYKAFSNALINNIR